MFGKQDYESDDTRFAAVAYTVKGYAGIAWHVLGWQMVADDDTEWSGMLIGTGKVVAVMVGDDRHFVFEADDLVALDEGDYCGGCGQVGCKALA